MEDVPVQDTLIAVVYAIAAWLPTLNYTHFIAFTVCFFAGYWLRGGSKKEKTNEPIQ
jgi:hypothetical protein